MEPNFSNFSGDQCQRLTNACGCSDLRLLQIHERSKAKIPRSHLLKSYQSLKLLIVKEVQNSHFRPKMGDFIELIAVRNSFH